jgi:hypothetical protein
MTLDTGPTTCLKLFDDESRPETKVFSSFLEAEDVLRAQMKSLKSLGTLSSNILLIFQLEFPANKKMNSETCLMQLALRALSISINLQRWLASQRTIPNKTRPGPTSKKLFLLLRMDTIEEEKPEGTSCAHSSPEESQHKDFRWK